MCIYTGRTASWCVNTYGLRTEAVISVRIDRAWLQKASTELILSLEMPCSGIRRDRNVDMTSETLYIK